MRHRGLTSLTLFVLAAAACTADSRTPAEPVTLTVPVFASSEGRGEGHFGTHMSGQNETPPKPTQAQGQLNLTLQEDGSVAYKLIAANIVDVTQAHIHMAPPGVAGPPIVWLYPSAPPARLIEGRSHGVLAEGVITDANVVGPLSAQGVAGLIATIQAGNAYANVHTVAFPPGEIRGQVR
ncbi:MAG: CHRD domain-containing protein [Gemmatimonadaceae bacterium]